MTAPVATLLPMDTWTLVGAHQSWEGHHAFFDPDKVARLTRAPRLAADSRAWAATT